MLTIFKTNIYFSRIQISGATTTNLTIVYARVQRDGRGGSLAEPRVIGSRLLAQNLATIATPRFIHGTYYPSAILYLR